MRKDSNVSVGRRLDPIEKAIRSAFDKGDPRERAFREKVYRSAFAVLERALQANGNVTEAIAQRRRDSLSMTISAIESEYLPAAPAVEAVYPAKPEPAFEPVVSTRDRSDHVYEADNYEDDIEPPSRGDRVTLPRRRWLVPAALLILLAALAVGAWWAMGNGMIERPSPPPQVEGEGDDADDDAAPPPAIGGAEDLRDWIVVFDPADPTTVTAPGDARAEVMEDEGQRFIRITAGSSGAPVLFDVGQGILEGVAGRRAVFNIMAKAQEGQETQISIECSLGELGDCGRKRYAVGVTPEEFLFEISLPEARPGAGGTIAINPDIENSGRSVDIHAIRVTTAQ